MMEGTLMSGFSNTEQVIDVFVTGQKLLFLHVLRRTVGNLSFHLWIKLLKNCCVASVDPRMVQETSPASSGKAGIESQQGLGEKGLLEVFSPVICWECG